MELDADFDNSTTKEEYEKASQLLETMNLWKKERFGIYRYEDMMTDLSERFGRELKFVRPTQAVPATKDQCVRAAADLTEECEK